MSKISKEGYEQILVIRNALDAMYDKLDKSMFIPKGKKSKNIDGSYIEANPFELVKEEFDAIASILEESSTWSEVK